QQDSTRFEEGCFAGRLRQILSSGHCETNKKEGTVVTSRSFDPEKFGLPAPWETHRQEFMLRSSWHAGRALCREVRRRVQIRIFWRLRACRSQVLRRVLRSFLDPLESVPRRFLPESERNPLPR